MTEEYFYFSKGVVHSKLVLVTAMHTDKLLTRLQRLPEKEKDLILIKLEAMGVDTDLPVDEYGNKILSTEFLETFARGKIILIIAFPISKFEKNCYSQSQSLHGYYTLIFRCPDTCPKKSLWHPRV